MYGKAKQVNSYKTNIVCSLFFIAVAAVVWRIIPFAVVSSSNYTSGNQMLNSRFMPRVLVIVLAFASLVNLLMTVMSMKASRSAGREAPRIKMPVFSEEIRVLGLAVIFFAYAMLLTPIGFVCASAAASVAALLLLRVKKWLYYPISLIFVLLVHQIFTRLLFVSLP